MGLEELYREVILDHYRSPRNRTPLARVDRHGEGDNPLCGDTIALDLTIDDGRISHIFVKGEGCSISQASASMMSEAVKGKRLDEVADLSARFKRMMSIDESADPGLDPDRPGAVLGDLESLQGVRRFPVRIKCAGLGWATLEEALDLEPAT